MVCGCLLLCVAVGCCVLLCGCVVVCSSSLSVAVLVRCVVSLYFVVCNRSLSFDVWLWCVAVLGVCGLLLLCVVVRCLLAIIC